jgi:copper resistance protein B
MRLAAASILFAAAAAPAAAERLGYAPLEQDEAELAGAGSGGLRLQYALLDRLEWTPQAGRDGYAWDLSAHLGGTNGLWLSSAGEGALWGSPEYLEFQALYSREVQEGLYLNAGLRWDAAPRPRRLHFTAGGQWEAEWDGADAWIGAFGYLSHKGELSARLGGIYNHKLTGRFYAQPSFELNASAADVPELGLGRGFSYAEAGLRLRYELAGGFAPYVGVSWERSLGRTARYARAAGEEPEATSVVIGVRSYWETP